MRMSLFSLIFGNKPITVISKYVSVNPEDIKVSLEKQGNFEVLEVNIVMPEKAGLI